MMPKAGLRSTALVVVKYMTEHMENEEDGMGEENPQDVTTDDLISKPPGTTSGLLRFGPK